MEKSVKDDHVGQIPAPCIAVTDDKFPEGMRVLAVDDDNTCLRKLEGILRKCRYNATVTTEATTALKLLREKKNGFDIVLTDVQMPEMDGFRLLEIISLEMDIPVIMISGYDDKNMIMKGIKHGARDYLLKPIRMEEIKNIWQHVVRKHLVGSNGLSIVAKQRETDQNSKTSKRHRDQSKDKETETSSSSDGDYLNQKKPRVTWSPELHAKFCDAVHKLGVDKAVPKRILELMDEQGLTRENVASHLQKFRNALKKTSARKGQQNNTEFDSNGMGGYLPNSTFSSFEDKGHDSINSLDGFRPNSYGNSDMIQYGNHIRNPDSFSISFGNPKPLLLPSNQQDILLQRYMQAPRVLDQMQQRMQIPGFGDVPLNPLRMENLHHQSDFNMPKYETVPSGLDDFMEISSHLHSYNASTEIGPSGSPLLGCGSISQHNGTFLNVTGSPFTMVGNASTELSVITQPDSVIGEVQNSLPGRQDGRNLVAYSGRGELEFSGQATGVQLHMKSSNMEHFTRNEQMKLDHQPLEHLETESIFHLSSCSSTDDDLNAAIKQFQQ